MKKIEELIGVETLFRLEKAFEYSKALSRDYENFIDDYVFGTTFYAYCAGVVSDIPVGKIYNYLRIKQSLVLNGTTV